MSQLLWDENIAIINAGLDLEVERVQWCMDQILTGQATNETIKNFLISLKNKGESPEEVGALVAQMYQHCAPISITDRAVDTVGTGGDGAHTINISTTSAIIAAAAGAKVIKHGNRAASSKSGSADLLENLGININLNGSQVEESFATLGIGFCFAPIFHPAMKFAAVARKELGTPTVFNILGPLANPARPKAAAIGVANERMHLVMAQVLGDRGVDGFVFRGDDGLDEITLATTTSVLSIGTEEITSGLLDPEEFGFSKAPISALVGGDGAENARITREIFNGEKGAHRDACILNAAAAIAAFEGKSEESLHQRISDGVKAANNAIDSGAANELVVKWAELTQRLGA
jgi:anthranilate phosphoribosyltransferase